MTDGFVKRATNILRAPLTPLTSGQRFFLKTLLLSVDHRVTVENSENPALAADPLIIALNHNGSLETILVPAYLIYLRQGRLFSAVSDWMFGQLPIAGWLFRQIDPVYVYNKPSTLTFLNKRRHRNPSGSIITESVNRLAQGRSIMIYPEGTRNRNPRTLLRGRPGIGHMVLTSKRPVLPVGAFFPPPTGRVASPGSPQKFQNPNNRSLHIRIGAPMAFITEIGELRRFQSAAASKRDVLKNTNRLAKQITHDIMLEIARLSGKAYPYPRPCLLTE